MTASMSVAGGAFMSSSLSDGFRLEMNSCTPMWFIVFHTALSAAAFNGSCFVAAGRAANPARARIVAGQVTP